MSKTDDHWSIVEELKRKAIEGAERIQARLTEGSITAIEAGAAFEMIYWMMSGLTGEIELEVALSTEATKRSNQLRSAVLMCGDKVAVVAGRKDSYSILTAQFRKESIVPKTELKNGFAFACEALLKNGYEKL